MTVEQQAELFGEIDIEKIVENKNQPRTEFKDEALLELAMSIEENGLIQPIILRRIDDNYELIAGERRLRASKILGMKKIPAIIKHVDEKKSAKLAVIENIQREDLNPIEEAMAYKTLMEKYDLTQEEISVEVGKSRSYIGNSIRLLNLDERVLEYIEDGKISPGHGRALVPLELERQRELADRVIEDKLNVRDVEDITRREKKTKSKTEDDSIIRSLEEEIMNLLGTKVSIKNGRSKGKMEIEYYGEEDLQRILDIILN